jgi:hypothetical protein
MQKRINKWTAGGWPLADRQQERDRREEETQHWGIGGCDGRTRAGGRDIRSVTEERDVGVLLESWLLGLAWLGE